MMLFILTPLNFQVLLTVHKIDMAMGPLIFLDGTRKYIMLCATTCMHTNEIKQNV